VAAAQAGSLADVVATVSPSVVSINVASRQGSGTGSGVIIDADGSILTNAHVVSGASRIQVLLADGRQVDARLVGADTEQDVAVIQVEDAGALTPASLATGGTARVGDTVLAFGSPLGLVGSVSAGIVSSVDREVEGRSSNLSGMIQTDAAINPGNSGGPLVNAAGQVVGMNTAIATTSEDGGNIGVGFAIPIDRAMQVANTLRAR
jgi:putative serine protease PepD